MLRQLAVPARLGPRRQLTAPDRSFRRAGGGLELVLPRRGHVRGHGTMTETMTLPELRLADWRATKDTLHLYSQIVGKIRLATTTPRNHWWNVPLYVDVHGLTTRRLHHRDTTFEITIDFVDHALIVRTAYGCTRSFELGGGLPVADFDAGLHQVLGELGIDVEIKEEPFGVPMTTPFAQDVTHASWDREAITRFGLILDWSDSVFEEFSGWFNGKTSPVHLFWHGLDLAVTRFSGRPGVPMDADAVTREAYTHEVMRTARAPRTTLLAFCQSAYEAGARLAGWDITSFTSTWCPTPSQLQQLRASAAADLGRTSERS